MANTTEIVDIIQSASAIADNFKSIELSFMDVAKDIHSLDKANKMLAKRVSSQGTKIFILQIAALGGFWAISKLSEKIEKMNARLMAVESEKEFDEMEKVINK